MKHSDTVLGGYKNCGMKVRWRKDFRGIPEYMFNVAIGSGHHNIIVDAEVPVIIVLMLAGDEYPPIW